MRHFIIGLLMLSASGMFAQSIVPNGSFEIYSSCPTGAMQINRATGWYSACQTPDYFNSCGASMVSVPTNWCGTQAARTGNAYGRVLDYGYAANYREYMQIQLSSPMVAGVTYTVAYYVNLNDNASIAHNGPEAYFSTTPISTTTLFTFTPHVAHPSIITDKINWTLVTGTYTAVGGESYLTLGQYGNDASVPTAGVAGGVWASSSYYIEDVSVTASILSNAFDGFTATAQERSNHIEVNIATASEGRLTLQRSIEPGVWTDFEEIASDPVTTSFTFEDGAPAEVTWYRARKEDAMGDVTYSEVREVRRDGLLSTTLMLGPNPVEAGQTLLLQLPAGQAFASLEILDLQGHRMLEQSSESPEDRMEIMLPELLVPPGIYLVRATTTAGGSFTSRLVVR